MGAGFNIQIINATPFSIKRTDSHSYQMEWDPINEIAANSFAQFYGEFNYSGYTIDDGANAGYVADLGNLGQLKFNVNAQVGGINNLPSPYPGVSEDTGYGVIVQWKSIPDGFFVYPTPDVNNNSPVGWIHDGVVSIGIGYVTGAVQPKISSYPTPNYGNGEFADDLTALRPSVKHWASGWMGLFAPCIENLTLQELTIPGTHDSGTYPAGGISQSWVQTQYLTIRDQLEQGVRSLDLRLVKVDGLGDDRFQIVHAGYTFGLTLKNVLDQINSYLSTDNYNMSKSKEIIILDFHQFEGNNWSKQDYQDVAKLIKSKLGESIIKRDTKSKTLRDIWNTSGRVVVGARDFDNTLYDWLQSNTDFWIDSVEQYWCGESVTTWSNVQSYMQNELNNVGKTKDHLWALMAQYNGISSLAEPTYVPREISSFFSGLNGLKSNIIAVDWWNRNDFDGGGSENRIPNFSALTNAVPLNILKGYRKTNRMNLFNMRNVLNPGESLKKGDSLISNNKMYNLIMQNDGNLVLYNTQKRALWNSQTMGKVVSECIMQNDGNFVIYGSTHNALWHSCTFGNPGAYLILQDDGNLVIYIGKKYIWASNTKQCSSDLDLKAKILNV